MRQLVSYQLSVINHNFQLESKMNQLEQLEQELKEINNSIDKLEKKKHLLYQKIREIMMKKTNQ